MSLVTNVILLCGLSEEDGEDQFPAIDVVNAWLTGDGHQHAGLTHLNGHEGGHKAWEADVFGGAFNYLALDEFMHQLASAPWRSPDKVQVLVMGQDDDVWGVVNLIDPQKSRSHCETASRARKALGRESPDTPWE